MEMEFAVKMWLVDVVGGCLLVPDCPNHEMITKKLY